MACALQGAFTITQVRVRVGTPLVLDGWRDSGVGTGRHCQSDYIPLRRVFNPRPAHL